MEIKYRKAGIDDLSTLVDLRLDFLDEARGLNDEQKSVLRVTNKDYILSGLLDGSLVIFIAEDGGKIIATSGIMFYRHFPNGYTPDGRKAYIGNMYTLPEYRKKGIAAELMRLQLDEAKKRGLTAVSLSATEAGRPVYEKIGFVDVLDEMVYRI